METKKIQVDFRKDLGYRCPVCGQIVQPTDDEGYILDPYEDFIYKITPCSHLVWCRIEENIDKQRNGWSFGFVRNDIALKIIKLLRDDLAVQYDLEKLRIRVSERSISYFLKGKYEYEDRISMLFARLPVDYDQFLPPYTTIYQHVYGEFSRMQFAIES